MTGPSCRLVPVALLFAFALSPAWGAVSLWVSPERLAARAPLIVEGRVSRSASGFDPATGRVATYITLEVDRVLRGPDSLERVVLREPGGRFGDLVLDVDAAPRYVVGEAVLAHLEPGPDGALRTAGMFFGKFRVERVDGAGRTELVRDLEGRGAILRAPSPALTERFSRADVVALGTVAAAAEAPDLPWLAVPSEYQRVVWDERAEEKFLYSSSGLPARWSEADSGLAVGVGVERSASAPGGPDLAVMQVLRALEAWTAVPESRLVLVAGDTASDYRTSHAFGPSAVYGGENIVLFGDPYDEIPDTGGCSGLLALGGYWRTSVVESRIQQVDFAGIRQLYVVFNDGLDCFLGDPDNLAEVAAHELGHGIGFGHSPAPDAIMRATAHGARGPRLGDDDRDAVHCHYPHAFSIERPAGGEVWLPGSVRGIEWTSTDEAGPDPGTVDLEFSVDDGATWRPLASEVPNDGHHDWLVPAEGSPAARVRLFRTRQGEHVPEGYPERCTTAEPSGAFAIAPPRPFVERAFSPRIVRYRGRPARDTAHDGALAPSSSP